MRCTANGGENRCVDVRWTDVSTNEERWQVERRPITHGTWSNIGPPLVDRRSGQPEATGVAMNQFDIPYSSSGLGWCYRVYATNAAGRSASSNQDCVVRFPFGQPSGLAS